MEVLGWAVLVPFSIASLLTGLIQGWGSRWGLVRHYWVLVKLMLNLVSVGVLLLYTRTLRALAEAATRFGSGGDIRALQEPSPLVHSGAALLLLLAATALSVFKPAGVTRYGQRQLPGQRLEATTLPA